MDFIKIIAFLIVIHKCQCYPACPIGEVVYLGKPTEKYFCQSGIVYGDDTPYEPRPTPWEETLLSCCKDVGTACVSTYMKALFIKNHMSSFMIYATTKSTIHTGMPKPEWPILPYVYEVKKDAKQFLCPHPMGYLWLHEFKPNDGDAFPPHVMPVDYRDSESQLTNCKTNKDCGVNQFCGDVLNFSYEPDVAGICHDIGGDCFHSECKWFRYTPCILTQERWTFREKYKHFCYTRPTLNEHEKQYAVVPNAKNLVLCNNDEECSQQFDASRYCLKSGNTWSGYVSGARKKYEGICSEAKPIAYIFSHIFDNLPIGSSFTEIKQYFPVDVNETLFRDEVRRCAKNADCGEGEFCGSIISIDNGEDQVNRFCYSVPKLPAPRNTNTKTLIVPEKVGIIPCNTFEDCKMETTHAICYIFPDRKYKKGTLYSGLCVEVTICTNRTNVYNEAFKWDKGTSAKTKTDGLCKKNEDCDEDGVNARYCVQDKISNDVSLCCYVEPVRCTIDGTIVKPSIRCGKNPNNTFANENPFAECKDGIENMRLQDNKLMTWCDMKINQCCQHPTMGFCPDRQTPLFNEPECVDYKETKVNSGTCSADEHAICRYGHCCPDARFSDFGRFKKGEYSYITNQPCYPGYRPKQYTAAYCDPESRKVIILGKLAPDGSALKRWPNEDNPKKCVADNDCSDDSSILCIYEEAKESSPAYCYHNPMLSNWLFYTIIIIVVVVIILAVLAGGFIFYKWRRKKKGNKKTSPVPINTPPTSPTVTSGTSTTKASCSPAN